MRDAEYRKQILELIRTKYPEGLPDELSDTILIKFWDNTDFYIKFDKQDFESYVISCKYKTPEITSDDRALLKQMNIKWK